MSNMTVPFGLVIDLKKELKGIKLHHLDESQLNITLKGHPTSCLNSAHRLGSTIFRGPWYFASINPKFVGPYDRDWDFHLILRRRGTR